MNYKDYSPNEKVLDPDDPAESGAVRPNGRGRVCFPPPTRKTVWCRSRRIDRPGLERPGYAGEATTPSSSSSCSARPDSTDVFARHFARPRFGFDFEGSVRALVPARVRSVFVVSAKRNETKSGGLMTKRKKASQLEIRVKNLKAQSRPGRKCLKSYFASIHFSAFRFIFHYKCGMQRLALASES